LTDVLAASLAAVIVKNRMFIEYPSIRGLLEADNVLPQSGKLRQDLSEYVSESPVSDFVLETLARELYETQKYESDTPPAKLTELGGYADLQTVAARIIEQLRTLPWAYALSIPLPNEIGTVLGKTTSLLLDTDTIRLVVPGDHFTDEYPLVSGIEMRDQNLSRTVGATSLYGGANLLAMLGRQKLKWDEGVAHVQVYVNGFIGMYGSTAALDAAVDHIKALVGLGVALGLFDMKRSFATKAAETKGIIHRLVDGKWLIERVLPLDTALSTALANLVFDSRRGTINSDEEQLAWAVNVFEKVARVFADVPRPRQLLLAAQWLFDSHCGSDEMLSFVQSAVVLEILLGDKATSDAMGLGELLRNRCAYSISNTVEERDQILRDFPKIYAVRSEIVHAGKKRLSYQEKMLHWKLQWLCSRVIQKEAALIKAKPRRIRPTDPPPGLPLT
jgi:hypothetical protein